MKIKKTKKIKFPDCLKIIKSKHLFGCEVDKQTEKDLLRMRNDEKSYRKTCEKMEKLAVSATLEFWKNISN